MNSAPIVIPEVNECFELMAQYQMLPNIRDHSIMVARVAELITQGLVAAGHELSPETVVAGALLHDIGKTACLDNDEDHALRGYEICMNHNLVSIAGIVAEHVILKSYGGENGFTEKQIVYYADKRVNHDQVVSLEERLSYILERYGLDNEARCRAIRKNYALCRELEKKMFAGLEFDPTDVSEQLTKLQSEINRAYIKFSSTA